VKQRLLIGTLLVGTAIAIAGLLIGVQSVSAQTPLTHEQRELIRTNCVTIKTSVNQLKVSDALLRVNRGQVYESMRSKLMDRFNSRLSSNAIDNKGVLVVTNSYASTLDTFRLSYVAYERQLASALRIDCEEDPDSFHTLLQLARKKRRIVHDTVNRLHAFIDEYRSASEDVRRNVERMSGGNS
jgi:type IV pilus biogenesis protein CpaD/CtpE